MNLTTHPSDRGEVALQYDRDEVPASGQAHPLRLTRWSRPGSALQPSLTALLLVNERRAPAAGRKWLTDGRWAKGS